MFYKFNSLAGRLVGSGQLSSYLPQGLKPASKESTEIIYAAGTKFKAVSNYTVKPGSSGTGEDGYGEVPENIKRKQKQFQVDDGVPVHLKGGTPDRILFGITVALAAIGLEECFRMYYNLAFPKRPE